MFARHIVNPFILTFLITIGLIATASGQVKKCADVNEYCLNHWDCCSNTCMSYLYRCMRNYATYPYTVLGGSYAPRPSTLEEIYEINFGGNSIRHTNEIVHPQSIYDRFGKHEVAVESQDTELVELQMTTIEPVYATETTTKMTDDAATTTIIEPAIKATATEVRLAVANENVPTTTVADQKVSAATISTSNLSTDAPQAKCSQSGVKCFRNDECCTQRCHGFLHQCVT